MAWFRRKEPKIEGKSERTGQTVNTEGKFQKCPECDSALYRRELRESFEVCIHCGHHFRFNARKRLEFLFDDGEFERLDEEVTSGDPLEFVDSKPYKDRIKQATEKSGLPEAIVSGKGTVGGHKVYAGAMDMSFIGGSMGSVVGEVISRAIKRAYTERVPLLVISQSGGARMMEGALSLMQMAKTS
ncbi:MAG: acetyl-CoA carboxylase carboxyl transferase subunit beta, partial [Acidobacteria bacterium]|nr:acetyl-CoA carboxylase carboxyl transferase subunit beta [Acidobacteriota bacterium]